MLADKGQDLHAVSQRMSIYAFMHLLVLGGFLTEPGVQLVLFSVES